MDYRIIGDNLPAVICSLNQGESLYCESGSMSWMDDCFRMETEGGGIARSRHEMHLAAFQGSSEGSVGGGLLNACGIRERTHRRHGTHPDYVVYAEVVGIESLFAALEVQGRRETRFVDAEEIQPGAVLTPFIAVIPVLRRRLDIAEEKDYTLLAAHLFKQRPAARDIYFLSEHIAQR